MSQETGDNQMPMDIQFKNFRLEVNDYIAVFTLDRPEVRNAIDAETWGELVSFMNYAETCDDIRAVILTGAGIKTFAAGADLKELQTRTCAEHIRTPCRAALLSIENSSKPVIAAVNGYALGGGFELMLACDLCVAASHAKFGLPETGLGIMPGAGGTQRLPRIIGVRRAKEMILTGKMITADEAVGLGLATAAVPAGELLAEARKLAEKIVKKAPVAIGIAKRSVNQSMYTDLATGINTESVMCAMLLETKDAREGITAFLEKRAPEFKGR